jgi:hypothetical protein
LAFLVVSSLYAFLFSSFVLPVLPTSSFLIHMYMYIHTYTHTHTHTHIYIYIFGTNFERIWPLSRGGVVVKALRYKPEGHGLETRSGEWFLSIYLILPAVLGPGVNLAANRNEYQKHKENNVSGE